MPYTYGCNKATSAVRRLHRVDRHVLAAMFERNHHRQRWLQGVKSAPVRTGLAGVDQARAHPRNVCCHFRDIRDPGASPIRSAMPLRALDSRHLLR